jgi:hypothetical protein
MKPSQPQTAQALCRNIWNQQPAPRGVCLCTLLALQWHACCWPPAFEQPVLQQQQAGGSLIHLQPKTSLRELINHE